MSRLAKVGLVFGGYVVVCLIASGIVYIYQLLTQDAAAQASAGMYAFGDLILFAGVCGFFALFPTGLAIYFLFKKFVTR
jgi:hypothetical protein